MARQIAVSFENEIVRVAYVSLRRGKLVIKKTIVFNDDEFDDFLKRENARRFTLVCDFKSFYQDTLFLPPVKERHFRNIVETEIRKRFPELKDFSFFYEVLGERTYEGKKGNETFVFAVSNNDLSSIIGRFSKYGKEIKGIYPSAFTMSRLVNVFYGITDDAALCVTGSKTSKTLFVVRDGKLYFIRAAQSLESSIHDSDVQTINMTINYCRQTLRLNPSRVILVGDACCKYETTMELILPAICMDISHKVIAPRQTVMEFIIPISAVLPVKGMARGDLLPENYRNIYRQKAILTYYTAFFIFFSVIGLFYFKMKYSEIMDTKRKIVQLISEIKDMEPIRMNYEQKKSEIYRLAPLIDLVNNMNSSPDMQKALMELSALKGAETRDINITSMDVSPETNTLRIRIKGTIAAKNFTHMQQTYQYFINTIKTRGMDVLSDKLDFRDYSFQIEVKYK